MDIFRCPVCGQKIGIFYKYRQSFWGGIKCSSCGAQLQIRKTGTGRANAGLIVIFVYFFLGIKKWLIPVSLLVGFVYDFIKCSLSPLVPEEQNRKVSWAVWVYFVVMITGLVVTLIFSFIDR